MPLALRPQVLSRRSHAFRTIKRSTTKRCCYSSLAAEAFQPAPVSYPDIPTVSKRSLAVTPSATGLSSFPYEDFYHSILNEKRADGSYRYFRSITRLQNQFPFAECSRTGKRVNVWCSNDYLAMGSSPVVMTAMQDALQRYGANSGGSRNIAGHSPLVEKLETTIAELHKKPAALYFSSGFAANEAALCTLGSQLPGCVIFSDELNHASMIEGIRHSRAKRHIWKHNDIGHLESLLASYPKQVPKIIAFESLYSMCGTIAPIKDICDLAERYGAITFMDECHAIGLYGPHGAGVAEHLDFAAHQSNQYGSGTRTIMDRVDIIAGSTSKGLGTMGGYIAASKQLIDMIRSVSRGFIFTTTQSPAVMAGAHAAIQHQMQNIGGRVALQRNVAAVKRKMAQFGLPVLPNRSHLVPVMVGDAELVRYVADILFDEYNIYVQPINSPTVAVSQERFRISPTGFHDAAQQDVLVGALVEIWARLGLRKASDWQSEGMWDAEDAVVNQLWTDEQLGLTRSRPVTNDYLQSLFREEVQDTLLSSRG
ncbi:5-aminolevulinate synthase [Nemania serpens]|nr:5-aminolevulinate synthase [Nemania serpens]